MVDLAIFAPLLLTVVPWIEMNGSIPLGIAVGLDPIVVLTTVIVLNVLMFFPIWIGLELFYKRFSHWRIVQWATTRCLKYQDKVSKYGAPGIAAWIALPGPFTGVYTATILAWLLRMKWKHSFVGIAVGVTVAAFIVWLLSIGALTLWNVVA